MALGRRRERQTEMLVSWSEMVRSPGHAFYDKLEVVLTLIVGVPQRHGKEFNVN